MMSRSLYKTNIEMNEVFIRFNISIQTNSNPAHIEYFIFHIFFWILFCKCMQPQFQ